MSQISLTVASAQVTLEDGRGAVTVSVTNSGTRAERVVVGAFRPTRAGAGATPEPDPSEAARPGETASGGAPSGPDPVAWTTVERPLREIAPGATEQFVASFAAPGVPAGTYSVRLLAYSADGAPEESADEGQVVRLVVPASPVEPEPPKRRWWIWVLAAVVLLVTAGVVVFLLTRPGAPPVEERRPASGVVGTVTVGDSPKGLAVDPGRERVYVAVDGRFSRVELVDPISEQVTGTIGLGSGSSPSGVAVDGTGSRVYVAVGLNSVLALIDLADGDAVSTASLPGPPFDVAVDPSSGVVYVSVEDGTVAVVDPATAQVVDTIPVGERPRGMAVDPDDGALYVANQGSGTVSVVDAATRQVTASVTVGANPSGVAVDSATGLVYVANVLGDSVSVIDPATRRVVDTIPVGTNPTDVAADPEAHAVYVTNSDGTVSVIDARAGQVIDTIQVGDTPTWIAVDPATGAAYVSNSNDGTVSILGVG